MGFIFKTNGIGTTCLGKVIKNGSYQNVEKLEDYFGKSIDVIEKKLKSKGITYTQSEKPKMMKHSSKELTKLKKKIAELETEISEKDKKLVELKKKHNKTVEKQDK
jgi:peptidoglycan hydrolase CwlO-like protein